MKTYTVTVNGIAYDVAVEETTGRPVREYRTVSPAAAPVPAPAVSAAPATTPAAPAPAPAVAENTSAVPATGGSKGRISIDAPMPGKILSVKASIGQNIKKGEVILILEAMKMENEIVSPEDGVIASIDVTSGDSVESGTPLATLN
ncbi:acetyl-CoA carboxylase biotin carboxyl carrier protein subunit [Anaerocolumna chitinilytica]|uniref:Acetyl-CoA carboxylase biotin carboxyl carrier protein subunit n=1 Tax=Anaerocolumna chitinilytica TaxID=1727145 RepID=A0A7I8DRB2_9FIRM|nr:acetyl-CoA carboxylase biotin carboxyl carrier protein subunit [Anaerocolumna chitinilytica]BCJ99801.1 acetyl-CoA carboxylase biotin carboxyl carrier protein subunit [Anaerocolumna chitinilytica]